MKTKSDFKSDGYRACSVCGNGKKLNPVVPCHCQFCGRSSKTAVKKSY